MLLGIILVVVAYLLGSVNFSILISKRITGRDIREFGSGNAGATNTLRTLGKGPAFVVFLIDFFKGAVAVGLAYWFMPESLWLPVVTGLVAVAGHNWPIFFSFRGGKGVATTLGAMGAITFIPVLIVSIIAITVIAFTRYVSLGSLLLATLLPVMIYLYEGWNVPALTASTIVLALTYVRHRQNIVRLLNGTESKLGQSAK